MSCWYILADYGLRSREIREPLLTRRDLTLCNQVTLIGSGMTWNFFFGRLALLGGFFFTMEFALGKGTEHSLLRRLCNWFMFVFPGSPLFIKVFFAYFTFVSRKDTFSIFLPIVSAWLRVSIVLFCNKAANSGEIFYGALQAIPRGNIKAANAHRLSGWTQLRKIIRTRCYVLDGSPTQTKQCFYFLPRRWSISRPSRHGSSEAKHSIKCVILRIKPLALLRLIRF